ncbi:hypothetical protein GCM10009021_13360 [Halarchaeum nitratireducens]|uniref:DUF7979 domain-containing protein n=1 Tax=Halarchaeum nitratireducens TaxID=489913 RepID=A0A830G9R2_9EURY|nr:hypothetical protein [Halarchaeum solikamskense]GGN14414.1 hypothetical protein GCM10009021_13360 [Halarchaeum nitratireducens]
MVRVSLHTFVAVCLIVLAGCAAINPLSPSNNQNSQYHLHVQQADGNVSSGDAVQFDELTPAQQRVFKHALQKGIADVPKNVSVHPWTHYRYVRYDNHTYDAVVSTQ